LQASYQYDRLLFLLFITDGYSRILDSVPGSWCLPIEHAAQSLGGFPIAAMSGTRRLP
jgi:hypothetical protein